MPKDVLRTSGRVKFVRPDGMGWIAPDIAVSGHPGRNIVFDKSVMSDLDSRRIQTGSTVKVDFKISGDDLYAVSVEVLEDLGAC